MEFSGQHLVPAPIDIVWAGLNDHEILKASIPGCEQLEKVSDTELTAQVRQKIGPVSASFSGKVTLSDFDPPRSYRITGQGSGGVAGFAKGGALVTLEEVAGGTKLTYDAEAQVGGKIAQLGSRLIQGAANKVADQFFGRFSEIVSGQSAVPVSDGAAARTAIPRATSAKSPTVAGPEHGMVSWRTFALAGWFTAAVFALFAFILLLSA